MTHETFHRRKHSFHRDTAMHAPLLPVTLAYAFGILFSHLLGAGSLSFAGKGMLLVACGLLGGAIVWGSWRRGHTRLLLLLLCWACCGALRLWVWGLHPDARLVQWLTDEPQRIQLHGLLIDEPEPFLAPNGLTIQRGTLALRDVRVHGAWKPISGRVRVSVEAPRCLLAYGDDMLLEGMWSRVPAPGNPGQYDMRAALARQRIHGVLRVHASDGVVILGRHRGQPVVAAVFWLQRRWEQMLDATFAPREAGLLRSLLLGERVALDEDLKQAFVETGTIHLLVISGFNVGLVAGLLGLLFRIVGVPWRMQLLCIAISLGGYDMLTGLQPPVVRATIMAWFVLGAYALDRVVSWSNTLAAAALLILWMNPSQLFDPGFQLSFAAVASLLLFAARWSRWAEARLRWIQPEWLRRYLAISLAATSAIWFGLSPMLAWYFHLVSPVSMLANLLIAPLMSALVSIGTGLLIAGGVCGVVLRWGSGLLELLLRLTLACVSWCHALPGGYTYVGRPSLIWLAGYYGLVAISMLHGHRRVTTGRVLVCWLVGLNLWLWSGVCSRAMASRWLRVDVLDVGHGDCIVVRTPRGQTLLVDTGSQVAGRTRVIPFLREAEITALDGVVLTHPDEDHLGGTIPLLDAVHIRRLFTNGAQDGTASARLIQQLAAAHHLEPAVVTDGMQLGAGTGIEIAVLHPPRGFVSGTVPTSNDNCVVLKLTMGAVSILLTGDLEEAGLPQLLRVPHALRATLLQVPHHGSRLGDVGTQLFNAVQPKVAIISVGRERYLPAPQTLRTLSAAGAMCYLTRDDGAIQLKTDGRSLEVKSFQTPTQTRQWRCDPVACQ